uniref:Secreted protein n=1 Tax=Anopheles melas TaxID=34690 RepID=A0A182TQY3_9DIPT
MANVCWLWKRTVTWAKMFSFVITSVQRAWTTRGGSSDFRNCHRIVLSATFCSIFCLAPSREMADMRPSPSGGMYGSKTPPVQLMWNGRSSQGRGGRMPRSFMRVFISSCDKSSGRSFRFGISILTNFALRNRFHLGSQCLVRRCRTCC